MKKNFTGGKLRIHDKEVHNRNKCIKNANPYSLF